MGNGWVVGKKENRSKGIWKGMQKTITTEKIHCNFLNSSFFIVSYLFLISKFVTIKSNKLLN